MKAVLFDLDETLLDRQASLVRFATHQAESLLTPGVTGTFVDRFIALDSYGAVWKDKVYGTLVEELDLNIPSHELLADYVDNFKAFCSAKPGAQEAVLRLHALGYKLGLVTNGRTPFQEQCFAALGLDHLFADIVVSEAVGHRKPDREIFMLACRNLHIEPTAAIFVGDNPVADIQGARAVGMYTIYIPGVFGPHCADADAVCDRFSELPRLVANARPRQVPPAAAE